MDKIQEEFKKIKRSMDTWELSTDTPWETAADLYIQSLTNRNDVYLITTGFFNGYKAGAEAERQRTPEWRKDDYIANTVRQIEKLEHQIEDMKCCGNCKHGQARGQICWLTGNPPKKDPCEGWE
jgi:hypothetical protein